LYQNPTGQTKSPVFQFQNIQSLACDKMEVIFSGGRKMEKHVLCYGDSNTWGSIPGSKDRYPRNVRWTGVLQKLLGDSYYVLEEGCNGRTTVWDDPVEGDKNGKTYLMPCLWSHRPVDLVVLMLGTNDLKIRYSVPPSDIARSIGILAKIILKSEAGPQAGAPKLLIVAPPRLAKLTEFLEMFEEGTEKSKKLGENYEKVAKELNVSFLDADKIVLSSNKDGIHWEAGEHMKFAKALAEIIPGLM
jgi:lysophospholipase L1-like esterase